MAVEEKKLILEPVKLNEDKSKKEFSSDNCQMLLTMWEEFYPKIGFNTPWLGYFIKHGDEIIGSCGFTGPPKDNKVEISYWTFSDYEGQGVSGFACRQLISIAKAADPRLLIFAKTAPEKNASTTILERNGFVFSQIVQDHEIGDAWEWVLA